MVSIIFDLMDITVTETEVKPGSRKGRPNYDREFRRRLAAAACEPGASVAKLARDNGATLVIAPTDPPFAIAE